MKIIPGILPQQLSPSKQLIMDIKPPNSQFRDETQSLREPDVNFPYSSSLFKCYSSICSSEASSPNTLGNINISNNGRNNLNLNSDIILGNYNSPLYSSELATPYNFNYSSSPNSSSSISSSTINLSRVKNPPPPPLSYSYSTTSPFTSTALSTSKSSLYSSSFLSLATPPNKFQQNSPSSTSTSSSLSVRNPLIPEIFNFSSLPSSSSPERTLVNNYDLNKGFPISNKSFLTPSATSNTSPSGSLSNSGKGMSWGASASPQVSIPPLSLPQLSFPHLSFPHTLVLSPLPAPPLLRLKPNIRLIGLPSSFLFFSSLFFYFLKKVKLEMKKINIYLFYLFFFFLSIFFSFFNVVSFY
jgi:hypothetical protein